MNPKNLARSGQDKAGFVLFVTLWNVHMRQTTPSIHFRMAQWLESAWIGADTRLLLMAFRASGKSTMTGLFCAWLLYQNPSLRLLVMAADHALASKMVRNVRRIIERHPLTENLRPKSPEQWAGAYFTVNRESELRDPSMMAKGLGANVTGCRADIILYDDVEVPNTCDTAEKRRELRERLRETGFVLTPDGTQLYIGTPHTFHTIYTSDKSKEVFLSGYKRLEIPIINNDGNSAWPEQFSIEAIEALKTQSGPNVFASQMMLIPVNVTEGRLDPTLLKPYTHELSFVKELRALYIGKARIVSASSWWDPAFGSAKGDNSVFAVVFTGEDGNQYIHHVEYIKLQDKALPNRGSETDEATAQCNIVAELTKKLMLPSIAVETNGIGKFLPNILRNRLSAMNVACSVKEMTSTRAKAIRILEAFDAPLAAGRLYAHSSVMQSSFLQEMTDWHPAGGKKSSAHDDGLDAVAGALSLEPVRLRRLYGGRAPSWVGSSGGQGFQARSNFEV